MSATFSGPSHDRPLAESIALATRSVHAKLNKHIIARLPRALPPRSPDPAVYISGLLHMAPIYITFEALWHDILDAAAAPEPDKTPVDTCGLENPSPTTTNAPPQSNEDPNTRSVPVSSRMRSILELLYLPGLMRSDRLRGDIKDLTGWPQHAVDNEIKAVGQMGRLGDFVNHIRRSVEHRPHVLLAYSYILFMALFAGGRFIRATLESVGAEFWEQVPSPIKPTMHKCRRDSQRKSQRASGLSEEEIPDYDFNFHASHTLPLRFFHFPTPMDGEDLKREFKRRLADSEDLLSPREKQEIVQEAVCIFDNMALIVQQLDVVCDDPNQKDEDSPASEQDLASFLKNPLRARLRDSVVVAKERSARSSRVSSSSEDSSSPSVKRTRNSREGSSRCSAADGHPEVSSLADIDLCPGFSKSMRFQKQLPKPTFMKDVYPEAEGSFSVSFKLAVKKARDVHFVNWLIMAGLGAFVLGALLSARRTLAQ